ncbi:alpha-(1,3)-fucosyltransferase 7 [Hoplias malabaricus]|uniref:alpha-(1,3)-fucosyltransferase 7 n=1 Tax=Hoplias malabaricus TaxID=27720 RepID=UPI003462F5F9
MRSGKKIIIFLSIILPCAFFYWNLSSRSVTILLWHWPFHTKLNLKGDVCLLNYSIAGCHLTDERSLYSNADIVVFHHHELKSKRVKLPLHLFRPAGQRWLWMSLESPRNNGYLNQYAGIFNLTMSYSPSADVTVPYGRLMSKEERSNDFTIPQNKTELVCWVVSQYQRRQRRSRVYQQLNNTIPVQVYGHSVKRPLSKDKLLPTISRCYFYLSFENSESPHYITEKLWRNAFQAGTVPVVLGPSRKDYEAVAPTNSFIHVDDFESIDALGTFLKDLARDPERYRSYFAWHQNYRVKLYTDWRERLCNICPVYDSLPHKIYHDLKAWEGC